MPDETNGINYAASCYKEIVQFSTSIVMSVSFWWNMWNAWNSNGCCIFIVRI